MYIHTTYMSMLKTCILEIGPGVGYRRIDQQRDQSDVPVRTRMLGKKKMLSSDLLGNIYI